jgi:chemotaxis protein CheY-P-specific phosphatase CheC
MELHTNITASAKEVTEKAYETAAKSLSGLCSEHVRVKRIDFCLGDTKTFLSKINPHQDFTVLVTEIIGEAKGKSYFILNSYEAEKMVEMLLRPMKNFESNDYYQDIILKELDNVISASAISYFSNALDLKIFGDVPSIFKPKVKLQEWLQLELEKSHRMTAVLCNATFSFDNDPKLQPQFTWILDDSFVQSLINKPKSHEKSKIA